MDTQDIEPSPAPAATLALPPAPPAVAPRRKRSDSLLRKFEKDEIAEINQYLQNNVPYSVLQQYFTLTENPLQKAQVFTSVYRLLQSAMRYVQHEETRTKLENLLKDSAGTYTLLYDLLMKDQDTRVGFNAHRRTSQLAVVLADPLHTISINTLIDAFLVFVEKQEMLDIDRVIGLDLETDEGLKALQDIMDEGPGAEAAS